MSISPFVLQKHPAPLQFIQQCICDGVYRSTGSRRHSSAKLSDYNDKIQKQIRQCLLKKTGVYISGSTGVGKTHLLAAIIHEIYTNKFCENVAHLNSTKDKRLDYIKGVCYMAESHDINNEIKTIYSNNEKAVTELIRDYVEIPHLFIDDFGAEKQTEHTSDVWDAIFNARWCKDNLAATYITSNLSIKKIQERYGSRISSRIKGMCFEIELVGKDKRVG